MFVYVIESAKTGKRYVGSTKEDDVRIRVATHNFGKVRSTKFGLPWTLVFVEKYDAYTDARKRELFLKSGGDRTLVKRLLNYKAERCRSG